ncbi:MAG: CarD family transcriptional regulator [Holosporales bacterium]|nr:CarD family transcriptional regulator [Holosporales bacterium]
MVVLAASSKRFSVGQSVVYPAHGVGKIIDIEKQTIDEAILELLVISFDKDSMKLRVPVSKAGSVGLRPLCSSEQMQKAVQVLEEPGKINRMLWSRRAVKYESKINSGDVVQIAEVVRDLFRSGAGGKQSYSERLMYQLALERLVGEYAAIEGLDEGAAFQRLEGSLKVA